MEFKWKKVCESAQELENLFLQNRLQSMLVFGKKICLVKASDGVYAFNDRCPHNGASLSLGFCNEHDEIVCPLHRYPFNVKTGKASAGMALCMETYPVRIQDDGVYVGMKKKWWEN